MTIDEFYTEITKHMTPEAALKKLLEGSVRQYENLKFKEDGSPVHPLMIIAMAAMDMGWMIAVSDKDKEVMGMVVGTGEYLDKVLK
jgi:hypothetical protein